jgi:hypothetical protein
VCRAWIYLYSDRLEKGKHTAHAVEAINLGFEPNTKAYCFFITEKYNLMTLNQARFDEYSIPLAIRKQKMVAQFLEQFQSDNSTDILYNNHWQSDAKRIPYNKLHIANYKRVHRYSTSLSDVMVMQVNTQVDTFTRSLSANGFWTS